MLQAWQQAGEQFTAIGALGDIARALILRHQQQFTVATSGTLLSPASVAWAAVDPTRNDGITKHVEPLQWISRLSAVLGCMSDLLAAKHNAMLLPQCRLLAEELERLYGVSGLADMKENVSFQHGTHLWKAARRAVPAAFAAATRSTREVPRRAVLRILAADLRACITGAALAFADAFTQQQECVMTQPLAQQGATAKAVESDRLAAFSTALAAAAAINASISKQSELQSLADLPRDGNQVDRALQERQRRIVKRAAAMVWPADLRQDSFYKGMLSAYKKRLQNDPAGQRNRWLLQDWCQSAMQVIIQRAGSSIAMPSRISWSGTEDTMYLY